MIKSEDRLIEDRWYHVGLEYDPYRKTVLKVEGKYHFVGRLVVHLDNKIIFNLKDNKGSVILPFENIKWMVPLYIKEEEEDCPWEDM